MDANSNNGSGRMLLPGTVRVAEREYIEKRRSAAKVPANQPLVGISLSGGGIRSATFALGVLQTLANAKVLHCADYLCTVSGGGYIGSCLTSLLTKSDCENRERDKWRKSMDFDLGERMPLSGNEPDQLHHLRTHGRLSHTQKRLFSPRPVASRRRLTSRYVVFRSALCLDLDGDRWDRVDRKQPFQWQLVWDAVMATGWQEKTAHGTSILDSFAAAFQNRRFVLFVIVGAIVPLMLMVAWRKLGSSEALSDKGVTPEESLERRQLFGFCAVLVGCFVATAFVHSCVAYWFADPGSEVVNETARMQNRLAPHWYPFLFFFSSTLSCILVALIDARNDEFWTKSARSVIHSVIGICFYGTLLSLLFVVFVYFLVWLPQSRTVGFGKSSVVATIAFVATHIVKRYNNIITSGRFASALRSGLLVISTIFSCGVRHAYLR